MPVRGWCVCVCVSVGCEGGTFLEKEQQAHRNSSMGPRAGWGRTAGRVWRTLETWTIHTCLFRAWGRRSTYRNQQDPFFSGPPTDTKENGIEL